MGSKSRMRRTETPEPIWIKFCVVVYITDVVTYTNFGYHRLKGFWGAGGHISPFPIDFHRRHYNTLALPHQCVILTIFQCLVSSDRKLLCCSNRNRLMICLLHKNPCARMSCTKTHCFCTAWDGWRNLENNDIKRGENWQQKCKL